MVLAEEDQVVETFSPECPDHAFGDRVRTGRMNGCGDGIDTDAPDGPWRIDVPQDAWRAQIGVAARGGGRLRAFRGSVEGGIQLWMNRSTGGTARGRERLHGRENLPHV